MAGSNGYVNISAPLAVMVVVMCERKRKFCSRRANGG